MDSKPVKVDKWCQKHQRKKEYWANCDPVGAWICMECYRERMSKNVTKSQFFEYANSSKKTGKILRAQAVCGKELPSRLK